MDPKSVGELLSYDDPIPSGLAFACPLRESVVRAGYPAIRRAYGDDGSIAAKRVLTSRLAISCCPFALA